MNIYDNINIPSDSTEYRREFFNAIRRGSGGQSDALARGVHIPTGSMALPTTEQKKYNTALLKESVCR